MNKFVNKDTQSDMRSNIEVVAAPWWTAAAPECPLCFYGLNHVLQDVVFERFGINAVIFRNVLSQPSETLNLFCHHPDLR